MEGLLLRMCQCHSFPGRSTQLTAAPQQLNWDPFALLPELILLHCCAPKALQFAQTPPGWRRKEVLGREDMGMCLLSHLLLYSVKCTP